MSDPLRVTVGVPCYAHFHAEMAISLIQALLRCPYELHLTVQRGCYIAEGREACVTAALGVGADYLMFIDTDMQFPADGIERLVAQGKDIIGGAYNEKRFPPTSTVKISDGNGGFATATVNLPSDPFRCAAVGTGFMAVNLKRLTAHLTAPFFAFTTDAHEVTRAWASGPGEDTAFCLRAHRAGLEVWCDPTVKLGHWGEVAY